MGGYDRVFSSRLRQVLCSDKVPILAARDLYVTGRPLQQLPSKRT